MWTIRGREVALLVILGIVVAPAVVRANHFPDYPYPCESGADCVQTVSTEAMEAGKYFWGMFGDIVPGNPLIMKSPPNATVVQQTYDRIFAARCQYPENATSDGTWECRFHGDNSDFWIEIGVVRRVGNCNHQVYIYCNKCGALGNENIYREYPMADVDVGTENLAQLWWEPPTSSPSSSTLGTWWAAWKGQAIFNSTGPQANAAFAGSRTTHARNDLGVTKYRGLHYVLMNGVGVPYYKQFNGPYYWSFHDDPRYKGWRIGGGDFAVFTGWHQGPTPTAVPSGDIGCNHS